MKKLVVLLTISLLTIPAFSQLDWGIKAGLSTTSISMDDAVEIGTTYNVQALKDASYGFHAGAFVRVSLLGIYIQPELLFSSATNTYNVTTIATSTTELVEQKFNKLDIPVMLGVKLGPIRINAGPAASVLINSPKQLIDDTDYESLYKSMTFGYQAGIGVDLLKMITLDVRYEGSLNRFGDEITAGSQTFNLDSRANAFLFSVGLKF